MRTRLALGAVGVFGIGYGVFRLVQGWSVSNPPYLLRWLVAAVVLHDGLLAPLTLLVGAVLARVVAPRARRWVQGALLCGGIVTLLSWPLLHRQGSQPAAKVLLVQDYGRNLAILLGVVAASALAGYLVEVARDRAAKVRPPARQTSDTA